MQVLISDLALGKGLDIAEVLVDGGVDPSEVLVIPHMEVAAFAAERMVGRFRLAIVSSERTALGSDKALAALADRVYFYNGETPAEVATDVLQELLRDVAQISLGLPGAQREY